MKGLFKHRNGADPVWLAEELPGPGKPISFADRACCCPARPVVTVTMPPGPGHPLPADLLLCGHHYRASRARLQALGALVYDEDGRRVGSGDAGQPGDFGEPSSARRRLPSVAPKSAQVQDLPSNGTSWRATTACVPSCTSRDGWLRRIPPRRAGVLDIET